MGLGWSDLQYLIPAYGQLKGVSDLSNSSMLTNKNVPTQFKDRDQISGLINQGLGQGGIAQGKASQLQLGDDPFRAGQLQQVGQLQRIASGQQQGAGELAAQRMYGNALAAQQAQARMARGNNAAMAYRNAANQSAALGSTAAGMGQQAAMQDQNAAQGALVGALGQGRGADINVAGQNAQMSQQQQQLNAQNYLALLGQLQGMNQAELNAAQAPVLQANQNQANLLGGVLSSGAQAAAAMSDERVKKNVGDARASIDRMLEGLSTARGPVSYEYINPANGPGRYDGVMAQDLERSDAGRRLVHDTPAGKAVDVPRATMATLAASARLHERLKALEDAQRGGHSPVPDDVRRRIEALSPAPPPMPTTAADAARAQYDAMLRRPPVPMLPPGWIPDTRPGMPAPIGWRPSTYGSNTGAGIEDMGGQ